jgi:ParB family chromosome partitioning protein
MNIKLLKTENIFENLFSRPEEMIEQIAQHMKDHGYDNSQPINVWDRNVEENQGDVVVVDGHTRLEAAKRAELSEVCVTVMDFSDEDTAVQYAIHNQRDRRNITDAEISRCILSVDKFKKTGRKRDAEKLASGEASFGKSAQETAKIVGTSRAKVEKMRTIENYADEQTKQAVDEGKKSINRAYNETRQKKKEQKVAVDNENQEKIKVTPETPKLSPTLKMAFKKFLSEIKQAKMNGYRDSSKEAIAECIDTARQLLEE